MKIAIAQLNPTIGDLEQNAAQILVAAKEAQSQGARLLLTPELSLCGYPPRDLLLNPSFIQRLDDVLHQLAAEWPAGLAGLIGTVRSNPAANQVGDKALYNTAALIEQNQVQQCFNKRLLPTYDVFDEDRYFAPGNVPNHFKLDNEHIGVTICEDIWNDEAFWGRRSYAVNPIADLAELNVDWIANLSASPYCIGKQTTREKMLQAAAKRYGKAIVYVNQVGGNDDLIFDGGSLFVTHKGEVSARSPQFAPSLTVVDTGVSTLAPLVETTESAEVWQALVLGVQDYARKCGFRQVLLGLSGGIDSALVATIAAAALGPENVLGILMPSPYSSDHSISDAAALAENLGIKTHRVPIAPMMGSFDESLAPLFTDQSFGIAEENLQSRIRGSLLMAIANKFGHLLLTTGNKSEMAVGYCTLYGDMNGGLGVIADLPKTKVFALCRWLNEQTTIPHLLTTHPIPNNVITKPPSAELKPGQLDQDSLPDYDLLDDILHRRVELHQSSEAIVAAGHDPTTVQRITRLVKIAEFKRRQAAPGLKITDRAFGTGWRMPIAQRWQG
jgi:NAD+ synthase (glutamine-hydrolysing)